MSSRTFPPAPTHGGDIELMLLVLATVVEDRSAIYLSSPFTTGRRATEWIARNRVEHQEAALGSPEFKAEVMVENQAHAAAMVHKLRQRFRQPVIAPTALPDIAGWTQSDYRFFWGKVIENYAGTVVFLEGWEHSKGCAYEFLVCQQTRIEALDAGLVQLPLRHGLELIASAASEVHRSGEAEFLEGVVDALRELSAPEASAP